MLLAQGFRRESVRRELAIEKTERAEGAGSAALRRILRSRRRESAVGEHKSGANDEEVLVAMKAARVTEKREGEGARAKRLEG
mmetsp:Transcript_24627/g.45568  ORF Transcript_24627/g.45568 Transcript_24627/m.45568 type:complete len:83 (+) Transcript_24627:60-308(+)